MDFVEEILQVFEHNLLAARKECFTLGFRKAMLFTRLRAHIYKVGNMTGNS